MNQGEEAALQGLRDMGFVASCEPYMAPGDTMPTGYRLIACRGGEEYAVCGETAQKAIDKFTEFLRTGGRPRR